MCVCVLEIRDMGEQRLNKFVFGLLNVTQGLVKNVSICPCHPSTVFPAVPLPPVWIIFGCGFHMGPWGFHVLIALKFPFSDILCFEDTHVSYFPPILCPWVSASHTLHSPTIFLYMTWFRFEGPVFLWGFFHWSWSHVSSSLVKTCRVRGTANLCYRNPSG